MDANAKGIKGLVVDSSGLQDTWGTYALPTTSRTLSSLCTWSFAHPLALCPAEVGEAFGVVRLGPWVRDPLPL
jgi:hypothetical protein